MFLVYALLRRRSPDSACAVKPGGTARAIQSAPFSILKTEAMTGDFYWIDSSPIAGEISDLCRRGALDRWIEINTRVRSDDLLRAIDELTCAQFRDDAVPSRIPGIRHRTDFSQWVAFN